MQFALTDLERLPIAERSALEQLVASIAVVLDREHEGNGTHKASLFSFLQAGVGAATRTLQAKARESVSVLDFGATGLGVKNDAPAIQDAIDYVLTRDGGGTVYFPAGEYLITTGLVVNLSGHVPGGGTTWGSVILAGDGQDVTRITYTPTTGNAIKFHNSDGSAYQSVGLRDLTVRTAATPATNQTGILFDAAAQQNGGATLINVSVLGFHIGINATFLARSTFLNVVSYTSTATANAIAFKTDNNFNINCILGGSLRSALASGTGLLLDGVGNLIAGVHQESGTAYLPVDIVAGSSNNSFIGNYFEGAFNPAIRLAANANLFAGNYFASNVVNEFAVTGAGNLHANVTWPRVNPSTATTHGMANIGHVDVYELGSSPLSRTTDSGGWTDLDLAGSVDIAARYALLKIVLQVTPAAITDGVRITFRAKGSSATATDRLPGAAIRGGVIGTNHIIESVVPVPLNSARVTQYDFDLLGPPTSAEVTGTVIGSL